MAEEFAKMTRLYQKDRVAGFRTILFLVAMLLIWAMILGAGIMLNSNNSSLSKPTIIFGVAGLFCMVWFAALARRKRRSDREINSAHEKRSALDAVPDPGANVPHRQR
jgi:peptidoglycan/LPS O-acetylase OafA/YrhL